MLLSDKKARLLLYKKKFITTNRMERENNFSWKENSRRNYLTNLDHAIPSPYSFAFSTLTLNFLLRTSLKMCIRS